MRRISAALSAIIGTIVSIVTLPFRVLQRLLTPSRGRPARTRRKAV
ncbi:LPFR motif small protein [Actinomadura sp. B10D3]